MTVHAPLVGTWPALPLSCMISAHEATAPEVFAADINGALMDAQVWALWVIAHTLAALDTIHGPRPRLTDDGSGSTRVRLSRSPRCVPLSADHEPTPRPRGTTATNPAGLAFR